MCVLPRWCASDRDRYKKIWAMIMTNPEKFPPDGLTLPEEDQEAFGFEVLDRDKILKAFPNNERSKKIQRKDPENSKRDCNPKTHSSSSAGNVAPNTIRKRKKLQKFAII